MTRDPVDAAEIEHDLASQKGMDVDAREREIVQLCEDRAFGVEDWVCESGRDEKEFQIQLWLTAFNFERESDEALAQIRQLFRKEFQFYAQRRAERERDPS